MTCYHHRPAWRDPSGGFHFGYSAGADTLLRIPCGKCEGCKQDRATQWAHRCEHEAKQWESNTFLLLTYDDENLPHGNSLQPRDLQLFLKRFRRALPQDHKIRYFACGEYGTHHDRPHYHLLLFNWFPKQGTYTKLGTAKGRSLYQADSVSNAWQLGIHKLGIAEAGAAGYIAKYALKAHPTHDKRHAPFLRMSKGIGKGWLDKHHQDLQHGYLVQGSTKHGIPRYYRKLLQRDHTELHQLVQDKLKAHSDEQTTRDFRYDRARQYDAQRIHIDKNRKQQCNR